MCLDGWTASDCSVAVAVKPSGCQSDDKCGGASRGRCLNGSCACGDGFGGLGCAPCDGGLYGASCNVSCSKFQCSGELLHDCRCSGWRWVVSLAAGHLLVCCVYWCEVTSDDEPPWCTAGHGRCDAVPGGCSCFEGWSGAGCSVSSALSEAGCLSDDECGGASRGRCLDAKCACYAGYGGEQCAPCDGGTYGPNCNVTCSSAKCSGEGLAVGLAGDAVVWGRGRCSRGSMCVVLASGSRKAPC